MSRAELRAPGLGALRPDLCEGEPHASPAGSRSALQLLGPVRSEWEPRASIGALEPRRKPAWMRRSGRGAKGTLATPHARDASQPHAGLFSARRSARRCPRARNPRVFRARVCLQAATRDRVRHLRTGLSSGPA